MSQKPEALALEPRPMQIAEARGIMAVRRLIARESYQLLQDITRSLFPEIASKGRLFDVRTMGVTVVGFSQFDDWHRREGPPTREIIEKVPSSQELIRDVQLGRLGLFGTTAKPKLAINLVSEALVNENGAFQKRFADRGFLLRDNKNEEDGYAAHATVAMIYGDFVQPFEDEGFLSDLSRSAGLGLPVPETIVLDPVRSDLSRAPSQII